MDINNNLNLKILHTQSDLNKEINNILGPFSYSKKVLHIIPVEDHERCIYNILGVSYDEKILMYYPNHHTNYSIICVDRDRLHYYKGDSLIECGLVILSDNREFVKSDRYDENKLIIGDIIFKSSINNIEFNEHQKFFYYVKNNVIYKSRDEFYFQKINDIYRYFYYNNHLFKYTKALVEYLLSKLIDINIYKKITPKGVTKVLKQLEQYYSGIDTYTRSAIYYELLNMTSVTKLSVKGSVIFNEIFRDVSSTEDFVAVLDKFDSFYLTAKGGSNMIIDASIELFDSVKNIRKESLKKKNSGAFNRIMEDLDFITVDKDKYPITYEAIHSGKIPLGIFFRKSNDTYFLYNDNWELWELMLVDYEDVAIEIATEAAKRTTFEKDIMSYFYFTLVDLPNYLSQHTFKNWKGIPKVVTNVESLSSSDTEGTTKKRSALTPIVDNENNTVTVPYVTMKVSGAQTQYCYGLSFNILRSGFTYKGNVVMKDVEKQLNGRDDYGLMFYTLTGSNTATGYPTFLIIFERLESDTRVHFHRTHPMRSKNGDYNPVHNWTIGCYKWMIGNVNFNLIRAQQGDLAFIEVESKEREWFEANSYDNHCFKTPVLFATSKSKENILGYVKLDKDNILCHTEHMDREIKAGEYEIRQCRSFEANPKGIWTLRID